MYCTAIEYLDLLSFFPSNVSQRAQAEVRTLRLPGLLFTFIKIHFFHLHNVSNRINALYTCQIKSCSAMNVLNYINRKLPFTRTGVVVHIIQSARQIHCCNNLSSQRKLPTLHVVFYLLFW